MKARKEMDNPRRSAADCKAAMAAHAARIAAHYKHARAKHPYFAYEMFIEEGKAK